MRSAFRDALQRLHNALAFLSRLAPPVAVSGDPAHGLAAAVPFYPLTGLILGLLAALPALILAPSSSWISAWAYVILLAWMTRGLHWDGLADLADACGSNAGGDRFWEIIKDSRIGAFGVMALIFGVTAQIVTAQTCIASGNTAGLIVAPAFGRALVIILGRLVPPHPRSTLAAQIRPGTLSKASLAAFLATMLAALFLLGPAPFCAATALAVLSLAILVRIAKPHGGANGDFYGALIIAAEVAALAACGI